MTNICKMGLGDTLGNKKENSIKNVARELVKLCDETTVPNMPDGLSDKESIGRASIAAVSLDDAVIDGSVTRRHVLRSVSDDALATSDQQALRFKLMVLARETIRWIEAIDKRKT